jgi:hypothetical protein
VVVCEVQPEIKVTRNTARITPAIRPLFDRTIRTMGCTNGSGLLNLSESAKMMERPGELIQVLHAKILFPITTESF